MDISDIRAAYSAYSFEKAREEGKVWQWVLTHLLFFIVKCVLFYPIVIIWRWTGDRTQDTLAHLVQFAIFAGVYYIALAALIMAPFQ